MMNSAQKGGGSSLGRYKTINLPGQQPQSQKLMSELSSNPYQSTAAFSQSVIQKKSPAQKLPSLNLNQDNIKHIVKAYFKKQDTLG